jgi:hypothetical protein
MGNLDLPIEQMQIRAAYAACVHAYENLAGAGLWLGELRCSQDPWTLYLNSPHPPIMA